MQNMAEAQSSTNPTALVLLGKYGSGKSASGNTILGEDKFESRATPGPLTIQCQKEEWDFCGRRVTVIDTPDFQDLREPERHVRECREMCKGRECVYLLVTQIGRFTEGERDILERLEKKLGKISDKTIILFTYGDNLTGQTINEYVKIPNKHLQKLILDCGNRYQVFNNKDREEWRRQVGELMDQICRVNVGENQKGKEGKRGLKMGGNVAGPVPDISRQTQPAQSSTSAIALVLLGDFGSGKSASGNTILAKDEFLSRATADPLTTECQKEETEVSGRRVTVIDTPDFFHKDVKEPETHVKDCRQMCEGQECVYLLVIQIGRFTEGERDILQRLEKKLGKIKDRTIILFSYGDDLKDQSIDEYVENTNKHLQKLIGECGDRYHVFNNKDRDELRGQCGGRSREFDNKEMRAKQQVKELMRKIDELLEQDISPGKNAESKSTAGKLLSSAKSLVQQLPWQGKT